MEILCQSRLDSQTLVSILLCMKLNFLTHLHLAACWVCGNLNLALWAFQTAERILL